ncbi:MAG: exo-beta-N-acetylmuramidase NamZ domain-containing protein [Salinibacter sp.]
MILFTSLSSTVFGQGRSSLALWIAVGMMGVLSMGCAPEKTTPSVQSGAEVLAANGFEALSGQTVGLIVNHTSRVDTAHLVDRIAAAPNVELGAIFAPEHGLRGQAGAGESVKGGRDQKTGVPVYSLYDETRRPTPEELKGLDALVLDIQDVGARFYTYITSMGLAMQAAAEANLPFTVLDRPNPLGGTYTSGFVLDPEHESFVGRYPIPVAYGMTIGELARYIQEQGLLPGVKSLDLSVVRLQGWERGMQWPDTGREWIPPSPNLPTWETALLYPGMCFFEGVRVNEGRGTERPFLQIGAPWSPEAARRVVDTLRSYNLSGIAVDTIAYTPRSMRGAPSPRFEGQTVYGFELTVTDREAVDPLAVGIHALHAMYHRAQARGDTNFVSRPNHLTRLAGTDRLRELLRAGVSPDSIMDTWRDEVDAFRARRSSALLY